jgi:hypothetical protein
MEAISGCYAPGNHVDLRPLIIAFGNRARNGKDTAAAAIAKHATESYRHPVRILRFAEGVYKMCREKYGMTEKDPTLLQNVGNGERANNPSVWIDMAFNSVKDFQGTILITDLRYPNEAAEVKRRGGYTVLVERLNHDGSRYISPDRDPNHPSETGLELWNWDFRLTVKNGEVEFLNAQAAQLFEYLVANHAR